MTASSLTRPLRVLILDHTADLGGAELSVLRLAQALGPDIRLRAILFADGPLAGALRAAGVPTDVVPLDPSVATATRHASARFGLGTLRAALRTAAFLARLTYVIHRLAPDVVHTTSLKSDLLALLPTAVARRRLVWYIHDRICPDYLPGLWVRVMRLASRFPAAVLANSKATAATLPVASTVAYPGFSAEQGIDPALPVPSRPGPPVVGIIGRISPTKGQLEFVRAAERVLRNHPSARFRIIGAPTFGGEDYAAKVRAEITRRGLTQSVTMVGQVADTRAELDAMSVCVHASGVPEPFGQVVVEAMARGVPVIATDAGGVPEILRSERSDDADDGPGESDLGLLVPPADVDALAAAISDVLDDPQAARRRAGIARQWVYQRFSVERTASQVAKVWRAASAVE